MHANLNFGARLVANVPVRYIGQGVNGNIPGQVLLLEADDYRTLHNIKVNWPRTKEGMEELMHILCNLSDDHISESKHMDIYVLTAGGKVLGFASTSKDKHTLAIDFIRAASWNRNGRLIDEQAGIQGHFVGMINSLAGAIISQFPNKKFKWTPMSKNIERLYDYKIQKIIGIMPHTKWYSSYHHLKPEEVAILSEKFNEKLKNVQYDPEATKVAFAELDKIQEPELPVSG